MALARMSAISLLFFVSSLVLQGTLVDGRLTDDGSSPIQLAGEASATVRSACGYDNLYCNPELGTNTAALSSATVPVCCSLVIASVGNLPCAIWRVASRFQEAPKIMVYLSPLMILTYANTSTNPSLDNAGVWKVFVGALLVAYMASAMIKKLGSRNRSYLPLTSNKTNPPISDTIICCIFLILVFIALFCELYILQPLYGWSSLCIPLSQFHKILSQSSYYYQKAFEWFKSRVSNMLPQIGRPPQQGSSSPPSLDAPATEV